MTDITPELMKDMKEDFERTFEESKVLQYLNKKIENKTASYREADQFAVQVGEILAKVFQTHLTAENLPNETIYYNIAERIIKPLMINNFNIVSEACFSVQNAVNLLGGIRLKPVRPKLNEDRINGIVNAVSGRHIDDAEPYLGEPVVNFSESIVDETIRVNAESQYNAGFQPKIIRKTRGHCCEWCQKVAGSYNYEDVKDTGNNVFRRHQHCRCTLEMITKSNSIRTIRTPMVNKKSEIKPRVEKIRKEKGLDNMSLAELRKEAEKTAIEFYKSGKSGISFGNNSPEHVARVLSQQGSRLSLKKDIKSMRKKLEE